MHLERALCQYLERCLPLTPNVQREASEELIFVKYPNDSLFISTSSCP